MAQFDQVAGRQVASLAVVGQHRVDLHAREIPIHYNQRQLLVQQGVYRFDPIASGDEDDPIHLLLAQDLNIQLFFCLIAFRVAKDHAVTELEGLVFDAAADLGEEGVGAVGQDQADGMGATLAQRAGDFVALVTERLHGVGHSLTDGLRDETRSVYDVGNGSH